MEGGCIDGGEEKQEKKNTGGQAEGENKSYYMFYQAKLCLINILKSLLACDVFSICDEARAGVMMDATPHPSASVLLHQVSTWTSDAIFWS